MMYHVLLTQHIGLSSFKTYFVKDRDFYSDAKEWWTYTFLGSTTPNYYDSCLILYTYVVHFCHLKGLCVL